MSKCKMNKKALKCFYKIEIRPSNERPYGLRNLKTGRYCCGRNSWWYSKEGAWKHAMKLINRRKYKLSEVK